MKTIAVIARKGGSGKTTLATQLALSAHRAGLKTTLADIDPQQSAAAVLKARVAKGPAYVATVGEELFAQQSQAQADGVEALVIDTPAAIEDEIAHAIAAAHISLLVVRPTYLDIAASLQTAQILRRLRRPGLIVLNQAPVAREGVEPPAVKKALEALRLMQLPVLSTVIRSRAVYQTAPALGLSAAEAAPGNPAAEEMAALWAYIEGFVFGRRAAEEARRAS